MIKRLYTRYCETDREQCSRMSFWDKYEGICYCDGNCQASNLNSGNKKFSKTSLESWINNGVSWTLASRRSNSRASYASPWCPRFRVIKFWVLPANAFKMWTDDETSVAAIIVEPGKTKWLSWLERCRGEKKRTMPLCLSYNLNKKALILPKDLSSVQADGTAWTRQYLLWA